MNTQEIINYYGEPGSNQVYCRPAYPMRLAWAKDITITRFSCHKDIQYKLESIFKEVLEEYGLVEIRSLGLDLFAGCLNVRKMRGSNNMSVHSWGLAFDLHSTGNRLNWGIGKSKEPVFARQEYEEFWKIVEKYGGISLGRERNYDWMHFQFIPINT